MKLVDENKRIAADHLKTADKLIKAGEFDRANEEIIKARIADPRNLYILAYEERIQYAREEAQKKAEEEQEKKETAAQVQTARSVPDQRAEPKPSQIKIGAPPPPPSRQSEQESGDGKQASSEKTQEQKDRPTKSLSSRERIPMRSLSRFARILNGFHAKRLMGHKRRRRQSTKRRSRKRFGSTRLKIRNGQPNRSRLPLRHSRSVSRLRHR